MLCPRAAGDDCAGNVCWFFLPECAVAKPKCSAGVAWSGERRCPCSLRVQSSVLASEGEAETGSKEKKKKHFTQRKHISAIDTRLHTTAGFVLRMGKGRDPARAAVPHFCASQVAGERRSRPGRVLSTLGRPLLPPARGWRPGAGRALLSTARLWTQGRIRRGSRCWMLQKSSPVRPHVREKGSAGGGFAAQRPPGAPLCPTPCPTPRPVPLPEHCWDLWCLLLLGPGTSSCPPCPGP